MLDDIEIHFKTPRLNVYYFACFLQILIYFFAYLLFGIFLFYRAGGWNIIHGFDIPIFILLYQYYAFIL